MTRHPKDDDEAVQMFSPAVGPNVEHEPPFRKGAPTDVTDAAETTRRLKLTGNSLGYEPFPDAPGATSAPETTSPTAKKRTSRRKRGGT